MNDRDERATDVLADAREQEGELEGDDLDGEILAEATTDGLADVPVRIPVPALNANDPDPTAGASDIGGLPGGIDDEGLEEGPRGR